MDSPTRPLVSGPSAEFSNLERISLIQRLEEWYGKAVAPEAWACLWLSDLGKLRQLVNKLGEESHDIAVLFMLKPGNLFTELVKPC